MNTIKGFLSIPAIANNLPGQVATFGELSSRSGTFSRNRSNYNNVDDAPGVEFLGFTTKNNSGSVIVVPPAVADHILSVGYWVYQQYLTSSIPSNANKPTFLNSLSSEFAEMDNISINEILDGSPTVSQRMPDYIEWVFSHSGTDNNIKLWFADSRFASQYDDYEVVVLPPIPTIDNLNQNSVAVNTLLNAYKAPQLLAAVETASDNMPYTKLVSKELIWNSPTQQGVTLTTNWTAIIWGAAGNDNEVIKNEIISYISTHSTLDVWDSIYPTLYAENEFVVIPMWLDTAIPQDGLNVGIFSPAIRVGKQLTVAQAYVPATYAQSVDLPTFLSAHLIGSTAFFRSLSFLIVGNPNNNGGVYSFKQTYPDYINVQTDNPDWGRMEETTRDFITKLNDAFEKAMTLTDISAVPVGYTRAVRNNKVYLAFTEGDYNYLVLTKHSYTA